MLIGHDAGHAYRPKSLDELLNSIIGVTNVKMHFMITRIELAKIVN